MFNMHDGDMNIQNGLEQEIMNGVGGGADTLMYRFYDVRAGYDADKGLD